MKNARTNIHYYVMEQRKPVSDHTLRQKQQNCRAVVVEELAEAETAVDGLRAEQLGAVHPDAGKRPHCVAAALCDRRGRASQAPSTGLARVTLPAHPRCPRRL